VLDASITLGWCFEDEGGGEALAALARARTEAVHVPAVWPLEVGNALVVAGRRKRLNEAEAARFLELVGALSIQVEPPPLVSQLPSLLALARAHRISVYDASYLDLALRMGAPLATLDAALAAAARASGVELVTDESG
jgi:predicted nucleic acid-binding protein